jgi:Transcriptional regulators
MTPEVRELMENISEIMKFIHLRSYHKMNDKNVYPGQPKLLSRIMLNEGITQKELSEKSFVTPATITEMLRKLEKNHYIYRLPDETDKRIMRVYLTPEGRKFAEHSQAFINSVIEQLFIGFDEEELHTLLTLTKKMKNNSQNIDKV